MATSEAKHFDADEMNPRLGSSRSARAAAVYTIRRAASIFIATSARTMKADIPREPAEGSVTAMTAYHKDLPPLEIQHLAPLSTQSSPSARARVRIDAASLPASRSDSA